VPRRTGRRDGRSGSRGLAWRTVARTTGITALLTAWSAGVRWARTGFYGHPWAVFGQGLAVAAVATT
jgi:hypothetical protein